MKVLMDFLDFQDSEFLGSQCFAQCRHLFFHPRYGIFRTTSVLSTIIFSLKFNVSLIIHILIGSHDLMLFSYYVCIMIDTPACSLVFSSTTVYKCLEYIHFRDLSFIFLKGSLHQFSVEYIVYIHCTPYT